MLAADAGGPYTQGLNLTGIRNMSAYRRRVWAVVGIATALAAAGFAPVGSQAQSSAADPGAASAPSAVTPHPAPTAAAIARPAAAQAPEAPAPSAVNSSVAASENAEYHDQLMAAAASLKADIQAESDASAATVASSESGPTSLGMIVAGGVIVFAILVAVLVIPASLNARRRRREMVADMISGKPRRKR